jgi:hypothetical protein
MTQLKLYENVVIGNFLYGLGSAIRARANSDVILSSVNLLQQTPLDKELADVLLAFPGVVRLIEFKQLNNNSEKEPIRVEVLVNETKKNKRFLKISKAIHWFVETNPEKDTFVSRIVPYLDAYTTVQGTQTLNQFIEEIADKAVNEREEFTQEDLREYLEFVQLTLGKGDVGGGGLILVVDKAGNLRFVQLTDMRQLKLQHRDFIQEQIYKFEMSLKFEEALKQAQEEEYLKQTKKNKIKGPRHSGPSLG